MRREIVWTEDLTTRDVVVHRSNAEHPPYPTGDTYQNWRQPTNCGTATVARWREYLNNDGTPRSDRHAWLGTYLYLDYADAIGARRCRRCWTDDQ